MKSRSKEQSSTSFLSSLMSSALGNEGQDTLLCIQLLLLSFMSALGRSPGGESLRIWRDRCKDSPEIDNLTLGGGMTFK